jgi:hypothetical protein
MEVLSVIASQWWRSTEDKIKNKQLKELIRLITKFIITHLIR